MLLLASAYNHLILFRINLNTLVAMMPLLYLKSKGYAYHKFEDLGGQILSRRLLWLLAKIN